MIMSALSVFPAKAGIQSLILDAGDKLQNHWIPVFAGKAAVNYFKCLGYILELGNI